MPTPPKPDLNLVNLGAIIDQPFLFQQNNPSTVKVPSSQAFNTESTLIPGGSASGSAAYSYSPPNQLAQEVQTTSGAVKTTDYIYQPADMAAIIEALETKLARAEADYAELGAAPGVDPVDLADAKARVSAAKERVAAAKKVKSPPAQLVQTKWLEVGDGDLMVSGNTIFVYEGPDIVRSTTTVTTHEDPPRVDELETEYRYNDLGQVTEIDCAGSVTHCEYDPLGRLARKVGSFIAPAGNFLADNRTTFTYTPPAGDPNQIPPPNALVSSVNDSVSGPLAGFEETPEPLKLVPEVTPPPPPAPEKKGTLMEKIFGVAEEVPASTAPPKMPPLKSLPGDLDTTQVLSLYAYP